MRLSFSFLLMITMCSAGCDIFIEEYKAPDCEGGKLDEDTNLCWQHPAAVKTYILEEAIVYCETLEIGDSSEWYLPSIEDFFTLLGNCDAWTGNNEISCNSCDNSLTCFGMFGDDQLIYISSTDTGNGPCVMNFEGGHMNYSEANFPANVRCVREN